MTCLILIVCGILIYVPTIIIFVNRYYKLCHYRKIKHLQVRQPLLIYLINIVCFFIALIERPLSAWVTVFDSLSYFDQFIQDFDWILLLIQLISSLTWLALFLFICFKFYLLYYTQQLNLSVINQAWQKEINMGVTGMHD